MRSFSPMSISFFSPAKINLFLRVLGRRKDGYHGLASLFHAIDLGDVLTIQAASEDVFTCDVAEVPRSPKNLVLRALSLFRQKTGCYCPVHIHLQKKIPLQAGLGGGSSNAATTLWALNTLFQTAICEEDLRQWGALLGSDVPFFFSSGTAYCTGRGEHVHSLPPIPWSFPLVLAKPSMGLSTETIFSLLDCSQCASEDPEKLLDSFLQGTPRFLNDLEIPAFRALPELRTFKHTLEQLFESVVMTGSGTAFFAIGKHPAYPPISLSRRSPQQWYRVDSI